MTNNSNGTGNDVRVKERKAGSNSKGKVGVSGGREVAEFDASDLFDFDNLGSISTAPVPIVAGFGSNNGDGDSGTDSFAPFDFDFGALPVITETEAADAFPFASGIGNTNTGAGARARARAAAKSSKTKSTDERLVRIGSDIEVARIRIGLLRDNPWQYRLEITDESVADLVTQFRERGPEKALEQFPRVTTRKTKDGKTEYILVSGHRRRWAWKVAFGEDEPMPVVIKHGVSDSDMKFGALLENMSREATSAVEDGHIYNSIINDPNEPVSLSHLAKMLGGRVSKSTIGRCIKLLSLPPALQNENRAGRLPLRIGAVLADFVSVPGAAEYAYSLITRDGLTADQVEKARWELLAHWDGWQEHAMPAEAARVLLAAPPSQPPQPQPQPSQSSSSSSSAYGSSEVKLTPEMQPEHAQNQAAATASTPGVSPVYDFGNPEAAAATPPAPIGGEDSADASPALLYNNATNVNENAAAASSSDADDANGIRAEMDYLDARNDTNLEATGTGVSSGGGGGVGAEFMPEDEDEDEDPVGNDEAAAVGESESESEEENRGVTFDTTPLPERRSAYRDDEEEEAENEDEEITSGATDTLSASPASAATTATATATAATTLTATNPTNLSPIAANNTSAAGVADAIDAATKLEVEVIERFLRRLQELQTNKSVAKTVPDKKESESERRGEGERVWGTSAQAQAQAHSAPAPIVQLALKAGIGMLVGMCDRGVVERVVKSYRTSSYNPGSGNPTSYPTNGDGDLDIPWLWVERITDMETLALLAGTLVVEQWRCDHRQRTFPVTATATATASASASGRNLKNTLGWLASIIFNIETESEATEPERQEQQ